MPVGSTYLSLTPQPNDSVPIHVGEPSTGPNSGVLQGKEFENKYFLAAQASTTKCSKNAFLPVNACQTPTQETSTEQAAAIYPSTATDDTKSLDAAIEELKYIMTLLKIYASEVQKRNLSIEAVDAVLSNSGAPENVASGHSAAQQSGFIVTTTRSQPSSPQDKYTPAEVSDDEVMEKWAPECFKLCNTILTLCERAASRNRIGVRIYNEEGEAILKKSETPYIEYAGQISELIKKGLPSYYMTLAPKDKADHKPGFYEETILINICRKPASINLLTELLNNGTNPFFTTEDGKTPLGVAIDAKNLAAVKLLLHHGANKHTDE